MPKFKDPDFKPHQKSLFKSFRCTLSPNTVKLWKTFKWKRTKEIYPEGYGVFDDQPIKHSEIKQGLLGTCYLISALVASISHLNRITDLFITKEVNEAGLYMVRFLINGQYKIITVDDYFPVDPNTGIPAFSHSTKSLIWPLIIEKAWAKLNGSFENIMSGYAHDVLSFLLPGPSEYIDLTHEDYKAEDLW